MLRRSFNASFLTPRSWAAQPRHSRRVIVGPWTPDHVVVGLAGRMDEVLAELEAVAGWQTDRRQRPAVIMGRLDGIMTTVRNHRRSAPLETHEIETSAGPLRVPTPPEILRIKAWLIVDRNATRDFIHRHLTHRPHTLAALDDLLENGTLADWRPVLARVWREPDGEVATPILTLIDRRDYQETGALWSAFIAKARSDRLRRP